jgi:hypothetical protein
VYWSGGKRNTIAYCYNKDKLRVPVQTLSHWGDCTYYKRKTDQEIEDSRDQQIAELQTEVERLKALVVDSVACWKNRADLAAKALSNAYEENNLLSRQVIEAEAKLKRDYICSVCGSGFDPQEEEK